MDTDDLSIQGYKGIITESDKLSRDLTLYYGLLSYECENETEHLNKAEEMTKEILNYQDYELEDIFIEYPVDKKKLHIKLKKILSNIEKIRAIPKEKLKFDYQN